MLCSVWGLVWSIVLLCSVLGWVCCVLLGLGYVVFCFVEGKLYFVLLRVCCVLSGLGCVVFCLV